MFARTVLSVKNVCVWLDHKGAQRPHGVLGITRGPGDHNGPRDPNGPSNYNEVETKIEFRDHNMVPITQQPRDYK